MHILGPRRLPRGEPVSSFDVARVPLRPASLHLDPRSGPTRCASLVGDRSVPESAVSHQGAWCPSPAAERHKGADVSGASLFAHRDGDSRDGRTSSGVAPWLSKIRCAPSRGAQENDLAAAVRERLVAAIASARKVPPGRRAFATAGDESCGALGLKASAPIGAPRTRREKAARSVRKRSPHVGEPKRRKVLSWSKTGST